MFRATHRSSSRAKNCNCRLCFTYVCRCHTLQATTNVCKTRGFNYSFELLMMSIVSLETCWAIKKHWYNKFYYTAASFWLFLRDLYYDARINEHQVYELFQCCKLQFIATGNHELGQRHGKRVCVPLHFPVSQLNQSKQSRYLKYSNKSSS
jgi:hypothetical protein